MKKEEIKFGDWQRMLIGEVPAEFYFELLIRVGFIYLVLLVAMRLMGQRMAGQMSRNDLAALVSLAAAIGVPILDVQRGVLPVCIIALVVVLGQRYISGRAAKDEKFEAQTQDKLHTLVENGAILWQNLEKTTVSRQQLMAQLRNEGLSQLGEVERFYMEPNGVFTLVTRKQPQPGISILPEWDEAFMNERLQQTPTQVCHHCGSQKTYAADQAEECVNCGQQEWVPGLINR
ncbi:DUF421 domain-containing protein [Tellurirhabdus rosea]|uniref:DUF421 domain-containing protein n=1 Tax=Tellurirhabdus rosea TaxID=2674997 RepID=UPI00224C98AC|nr:YetF domain-containing protein [Tellurirhabdus rosea]